MQSVNALEKLVGDLQNSLKRESATALVEQVLQRGTKKIHDHYIVVVLGTEVVHRAEPMALCQLCVIIVERIVIWVRLGTLSVCTSSTER